MYQYRRRLTREVPFGPISLGGYQPIRVESMTNTHTSDTRASVEQCRRLYEAGCEIIRLTVPTERDAESLKAIRDQLRRDRIDTPLVADIHFSAKAAMKAVEFVENIRINPGNYASRPGGSKAEYSDEEYQREIDQVRQEFLPLVEKARSLGASMRIGTNHGSLSDRVVSRWGNSPEGMVEAALEFARLCEEVGYHDFLFSMKSSNVRVMIQAYRLLARKGDAELQYAYPLHLGVTEAGDGDEGRIKSAMGIGALLEDGLGDTIRVSLTEDPVNEVPVGFAIVKKYNEFQLVKGDRAHLPLNQIIASREQEPGEPGLPEPFDPVSYRRRSSRELELGGRPVGNGQVPRIETALRTPLSEAGALLDEALRRLAPDKPEEAIRSEFVSLRIEDASRLADLDRLLDGLGDAGRFVVGSTADPALLGELLGRLGRVRLEIVEGESLPADLFDVLQAHPASALELSFIHRAAGVAVPAEVLALLALKASRLGIGNLLLSVASSEGLFPLRRLAAECRRRCIDYPIVVRHEAAATGRLERLIEASVQAGSAFADGIGDIIALDTGLGAEEEADLAANILQAARSRMSKTEFISCPGCGRTYFDLEKATASIKGQLSHLKGLKIGIMGCIVNGPGEMADADFGYVGAGKNRISLYVGKECVAENIGEEEAVERLITLIREHGRWVEPQR